MALVQVTPPSAEPVTLAEAKAHLRVIDSSQDAYIASLIPVARAHLDGKDGILGRALMTQTWELIYDYFPSGAIRIPLPPLQQVVSIKYLDSTGAEVTLPTTAYRVDSSSEPGWVAAGPDGWPQTFDTINAVRIRFQAGYADAASVPRPLWAAILMMIGDLYENREAQLDSRGAVTENATVDRLVFPYRMFG